MIRLLLRVLGHEGSQPLRRALLLMALAAVAEGLAYGLLLPVLRALFAGSTGVEVIEAAVGEKMGRASLLISERTPTVTTIAGAWHEARAKEPDFSHVKWNREVEIETTTLDLLIERFGAPAFNETLPDSCRRCFASRPGPNAQRKLRCSDSLREHARRRYRFLSTCLFGRCAKSPRAIWRFANSVHEQHQCLRAKERRVGD